jgi:hypothetical protein
MNVAYYIASQTTGFEIDRIYASLTAGLLHAVGAAAANAG